MKKVSPTHRQIKEKNPLAIVRGTHFQERKKNGVGKQHEPERQ